MGGPVPLKPQDEPLPLLILDQGPGMAGRGAVAEVVNPPVSTLLSPGLTPVTTATISDPPRPAPGWRLELSALRAVRLTAPDGSVIWAGECGQAEPWRALITWTGPGAVLVGAICLWIDSGSGSGSGERARARIETRLDQAADAGDLAGGVVEAAFQRAE